MGLAYLQTHEAKLRGREGGAFDDDTWYRFGRNQNLDKQELPKLCVAQTVPSLRVCYDSEGAFYFNNVRVNGVLPHSVEAGWFLLGVLNAPVCDFVFRRIAKPKEGGYFEANKQFIAPLPIPDATPDERREICERARALQEGCTRRRDLAGTLEDRLWSAQTLPLLPIPRPHWLWADVRTTVTWKSRHPSLQGGAQASGQAATAREISAWAKAQHEAALAARLAVLDALLVPGAKFRVENTADQLALFIDGIEVLRLYDKPDTPFVAAQWRHALRDVNVTEAFDGRRLMRLLLDLRTTADAGLRDRIVALDAEITVLDADLAAREATLNALLYRLYALNPEEIALVEGA